MERSKARGIYDIHDSHDIHGFYDSHVVTTVTALYNPPVRSAFAFRLSGRQGRTWMSMLDIMMVGGVVVLVALIVMRKKR
jgi:hypothetical protein